MLPSPTPFVLPRETNQRRHRAPRPGDIDHPDSHHIRAIQNDPAAGLNLDPCWEPHPNGRIEQPTQLETTWRHNGWRVHRQLTWEALRRWKGAGNATYRFARCGAQAIVAKNAATGEYRIQSFTCKSRFCSPCRQRMAGIIQANVIEHASHPDRRQQGKRLRSITLTLRHSTLPLSEQISRLMRCFAKLRRSRSAKRCLLGGFYVVELKVSSHDNCWHPHIHLVSEGHYVSHADLQSEWLRITGDSHRVHVMEVKNLKNEVGHHCKYLTKAADSSIYKSRAHLDEYIRATSGRRLASAFGNWRGLKIARPKKCAEVWTTVGYLDFIVKEAGRGVVSCEVILKALLFKRDGGPSPPTDP